MNHASQQTKASQKYHGLYFNIKTGTHQQWEKAERKTDESLKSRDTFWSMGVKSLWKCPLELWNYKFWNSDNKDGWSHGNIFKLLLSNIMTNIHFLKHTVNSGWDICYLPYVDWTLVAQLFLSVCSLLFIHSSQRPSENQSAREICVESITWTFKEQSVNRLFYENLQEPLWVFS